MGAVLAFVGQPEPHAGFDSGRNMDGNRPFFIDALPALADRTGLRYDLPGAFALAAGPADAEKTLLKAKLSSAFAAGAGSDGRRRLRSGAFTVDTAFPARNLELRFFAVDGFLEGQLQVVLEIASPFRAASATGLSEEVFENIVKNVAETAAVEIESIKASSTLLRAGMPEHVVTLPFVLVAQGFVGFVDFFELFFGGFFLVIAGVQVGVVLAGHLSIGLLEFVIGDGFLDAEDVVIISFAHHGYHRSRYTDRPKPPDDGPLGLSDAYCMLLLVLVDFFEFRVDDFFIGLGGSGAVPPWLCALRAGRC